MEKLKQQVMEEYLNDIIHNENGIKFIYEEDLNKFKFNDQETKFVMDILKEEAIELRKEVISKKDRPELVRDYNYGDIASNNLESIDIPEKSIIEYDSEKNISFENYQDLEKYLENDFIPSYIQMKKTVDKDTGDITYIPSIQLNHIVKLRLSELEVQYVFEYLDKLNIKVAGVSPDINLDSYVKNYDYVKTFKESQKPIHDPNLNDENRIELYHKTGDVLLRNDIIKNNVRLASFVAYKYSIITGIDVHELESYAYEGLITAIENFKNKGVKFSTYAYPCIRGAVLNGIPYIESIYKNNFYYGYVYCKNVVEETNNTTIEENPELLKDVYDLMIQTKKLSASCDFSEFKNLVFISKPISLENMDEIESDYDIEEEALTNLTSDSIKEALDNLTDREKFVIIHRFGLFGNQQKLLEEVAEMLNLTRERVRQIEKKALKKLRHPMNSRKLR